MTIAFLIGGLLGIPTSRSLAVVSTGRRWVGVYEVTPTEVVNLAWSGPAPPAHPTFPAAQGLTEWLGTARVRSRFPTPLERELVG